MSAYNLVLDRLVALNDRLEAGQKERVTGTMAERFLAAVASKN